MLACGRVSADEIKEPLVSQADVKTPARVAGKSIEQYAELLESDNRVERLRAIKSLGSFGGVAAPVIAASLGHEDAAVRYTAAVHLGRIGGDALNTSVDAINKQLAVEKSPAVTIAFAFAVCASNCPDDAFTKHLAIMTDALDSPTRGVVCSTCELLGDLGEKAKPALEKLRQVHGKNKFGVKGGDYHRGGAAMNAIRKIEPHAK